MWQKLTAGLRARSAGPVAEGAAGPAPAISTGPVKALFEVLAGPVAQPSTPGVRFGRFRRWPSTAAPRSRCRTAGEPGLAGELKATLGVTGYPAIELMTLVETGTRALIGAVFGPRAPGETAYARQLLHAGTGHAGADPPRL